MSGSDKNFYPPPGQRVSTEENVSVTVEQNPAQRQSLGSGKHQDVPPGQPQNMQLNQQAMPQQYMPSNQPQMQYRQQQMPQQQNYQQQQMPQQQQYVPQMPQQQFYQPQMPQQQFYQQPHIGQQFQSPVQPMPGPMTGQSPYPFLSTPLEPWTTHLFDCAQDMDNCRLAPLRNFLKVMLTVLVGFICLITTFFPCITFGQIAEITDRGTSSCSGAGLIYGLLMWFTGFHWIYSWMYRTRLRATYNLMEDPFHDCLVHFLCDPCALCQEYRELKNRGFNMQLGWIGNMQLQAQQAAATGPPPVQGMTR